MTQEHSLWVPLAPCMVMLVKADLTLSNLAWESLSLPPLSYQTEKHLSPLAMRLSVISVLASISAELPDPHPSLGGRVMGRAGLER